GNLAASATVISDRTAPSAFIPAVLPEIRSTDVDSLQIVFNEAVTGFDLADLSLSRNAGANLLTSTQTITTSDNITFTIGNLSVLTGPSGTYLLALAASGTGIHDVAGNSLAIGATAAWTRVNQTVSLSVDQTSLAESAGTTTITATLSAVADVDVVVMLGFTGTADSPSDYQRSGTEILITAGSTSGSAILTAVQDAKVEGTEVINVAITGVTNATAVGQQEIQVQIIDDDFAPLFTSSATFSVPENTLTVGSVVAIDPGISGRPVSYSISGGADAALFQIATNTGELSFLVPPDFGNPSDAGRDNVYNLQVTADDGTDTTTNQDVSVAVTNVAPQLILSTTNVTWSKNQNPIPIMPQISVVGDSTLGGGLLSISVIGVITTKKGASLDTITHPSFSAIGTVLGTDRPDLLRIQLAQNVKPQDIQSFLREIRFSTKGIGLRAATRTVIVSLADASIQVSQVSLTIHVNKHPQKRAH
ncbi:MAG: Cadherin repeat protein, partial [Planctomycetaceae bacterium]|nr:Cadherin repeat protein [Planctomycetaceae bacterium]